MLKNNMVTVAIEYEADACPELDKAIVDMVGLENCMK